MYHSGPEPTICTGKVYTEHISRSCNDFCLNMRKQIFFVTVSCIHSSLGSKTFEIIIIMNTDA